MTFGEKNIKQLFLSLTTLGVTCLGTFPLTAVVTGMAPPGEAHPKNSNELTLEQLATSLSLNPIHQVQFEELYESRFLTSPIKKSGWLSYTPPSRLEKHVVTPTKESFVINEDTVQYTNLTQGTTHTLALQDIPPLQVLITGLRSIFSGDLTTLQRHFRVELNGIHHQWGLVMVPLNEKIQESVTFIRLRGTTNRISEIQIHESNGDLSTLLLKER